MRRSTLPLILGCALGAGAAPITWASPFEPFAPLTLPATRIIVKVTHHCTPTACIRLAEFHEIREPLQARDFPRDTPLGVAPRENPPPALLAADLPPALQAGDVPGSAPPAVTPPDFSAPDLPPALQAGDVPGSAPPAAVLPARAPPAPPALEAQDLPGSTPSTAASPANADSCGDPLESRALTLLNTYRQAQGLLPLRCDPLALRVARAHSQDMCDRSYFSHHSPEGAAPWDRLRQAGGRFRTAGENIAMGHTSAAEVHQGWVESSGHQQNLVGPSWRRAAIGLVNCRGSLIWTQLFAG